MIPRVTVCIPTYNRSRALRATVDSVIAQTFIDWELILLDDGSTDDTSEVAQSYDDPRIRYIRQENQGHAVARNVGLNLAAAELIAYLDHDDRWRPDKLQLQVAYLDEHPEVGLVYGRWHNVDEKGVPQTTLDRYEGTGWVFEDLLREHNFVHTMSLPLIRTELVRRVGGFDRAADISDDLDLLLRLARITPFGFIPKVLCDYNIGVTTQQTRNMFRVYHSERSCIERYIRIGPRLSRSQRVAVRRSWGMIFGPAFRELGWHAFQERHYHKAWHCYTLAVSLQPLLLLNQQFCRDILSLCKNSVMVPLRRRTR